MGYWHFLSYYNKTTTLSKQEFRDFALQKQFPTFCYLFLEQFQYLSKPQQTLCIRTVCIIIYLILSLALCSVSLMTQCDHSLVSQARSLSLSPVQNWPHSSSPAVIPGLKWNTLHQEQILRHNSADINITPDPDILTYIYIWSLYLRVPRLLFSGQGRPADQEFPEAVSVIFKTCIQNKKVI